MKSPSESAILLIIAAVTATVLYLDTITPLGTALWLIYLLPLMLAYASRRPAVPPLVSIGLVLCIAVGFRLANLGVDPRLALMNRGLASLVILLLGGIGFVLIRNREALAKTDWVQRGEVRTAQLLQGEQDTHDLGDSALRVLSEYLGARAGVAYAREGGGFRRIASWGTDETLLPSHLSAAGGHLSRAVQENRILSISTGPEDALGWGSALLHGKSAHSVILPLHDGAEVNGVFEIGLDEAPDESALTLLGRVGEKIGVALRSARYREELRELLEETRRQSEELRTHTEELAATNEELEEQTRALQESERRLSAQQAELEQQNAQLETQTQQLGEQRDALAQSRRQLVGQAEKLARESRYKSEFVANMSHELRTPLNALLIMARLLADNRSRT